MINPFLFKFDVDSSLRINIALQLFHDHFDKQATVSGLLIINRIQYNLVSTIVNDRFKLKENSLLINGYIILLYNIILLQFVSIIFI